MCCVALLLWAAAATDHDNLEGVKRSTSTLQPPRDTETMPASTERALSTYQSMNPPKRTAPRKQNSPNQDFDAGIQARTKACSTEETLPRGKKEERHCVVFRHIV